MAAAERAGLVALMKKVRESLGGGPDAIAVFKGFAAEAHFLRRAHRSTMRVWFQSVDDVQKSGFL
jgi:hypothetical protein